VRHFNQSLSALLFALVTVSACSDLTGPGLNPLTELPRTLSVAEQQVIGSATAFGFDLIREVAARDQRPNVVLSPFSASMALAMALNGSDGETFDEMRTTLGFPALTLQEINDAFSSLTDLLTTLDPDVRFEVGNSLWANEDVPFHEAFTQSVAAAFDARAESRDFADPATLEAINAWAAENTDGLIDSILDELDPTLALLLMNAIYFDAPWASRFDPDDTTAQDFRRADDSVVPVDMMSLGGVEVRLGQGPDYAAVELPYASTAFTMVIIVPHEDARAFLAELDQAEWDAVLAGLQPTTVDLLSIPKFSLTYDGFLNDALEEMGMGRAFRPGADFTRMSPVGDRLCIDFVRQKTFIEIDEQGTRAAAVTAVGVGVRSFTGLIVDRPFVFALRERLSGAVLFVGLVGDPTAEDPGPEDFASACG
jgi:serine protease inhibitor